MTDFVTVIEQELHKLKGKQIRISYGKGSVSGCVQSVKGKEYFYELVLKCGRYKKKMILFYPFSIKVEKGNLIFDYRLKSLPNYFGTELVYNLSGGNAHPFYNTIVQVCELT